MRAMHSLKEKVDWSALFNAVALPGYRSGVATVEVVVVRRF